MTLVVTASPPSPLSAPPSRKFWRSPPLWLLALSVGLLAVVLYFYVPSLFFAETDDAAIQADTVTVMPKVAAYVTALHVTDNSSFKAGDLLLELDPRDFITARDDAAAALRSAQAAEATVRAQLSKQSSVIAADAAKIAGDQASMAYADQELHRFAVLADSGAGTVEASQKARSDYGVAQAALAADDAQLDAAKAELLVLQGQLQQADASTAETQAELSQAALNLSYTKIYAPVSGTVANRTVQVGNYVQAGQELFNAVPDKIYVIANFKETDLVGMRAGQHARITVDAFPGLTLDGHVDSFQRGTGSYFALLPPENATGNFVKIIQRVPVKIVLDNPAQAPFLLAPGMSVEVAVTVRDRWHWLL